jgi:hypothetical protein
MIGQKEPDMRHWPVQDAKAHFSELLESCLPVPAAKITGGPAQG